MDQNMPQTMFAMQLMGLIVVVGGFTRDFHALLQKVSLGAFKNQQSASKS